MHLNPDHLLALALVHETGSLSGAARELGKTQPALSMQMRALSGVVGLPVVLPSRRGVRLTDVGIALLPHAQAIARALRSASIAIDTTKGKRTRTLRVYTSTSVAVYLLPLAITRLKADIPEVDVHLTRRPSESSIEALTSGKVDLVIERVENVPPPPVGFDVTRIFEDSTVFAVRPDHPLAGAKSLAINDILKEGIVAQEHPSRTRRLIERLFQERGAVFSPSIETIGVEAVKEAVLQGFGAGFLPRVCLERDVARGDLVAVNIDHPALQRSVIAIHVEGKLKTDLCKAFLHALCAVSVT